jgi:hypothetical protein
MQFHTFAHGALSPVHISLIMTDEEPKMEAIEMTPSSQPVVRVSFVGFHSAAFVVRQATAALCNISISWSHGTVPFKRSP